MRLLACWRPFGQRKMRVMGGGWEVVVVQVEPRCEGQLQAGLLDLA